jgi:hypothetical protein
MSLRFAIAPLREIGPRLDYLRWREAATARTADT